METFNITKLILLLLGILTLSACSMRDATTDLPANDPTSNQKPNAVITPSNEQFLFRDESLTLRGDSSNDSDANLPLSYQWTFSGAAAPIAQSTDENPGLITFSMNGIVTATLVVTDSLGLSSDPASVIIHIDEPGTNRAPVGSISHNLGAGAISIRTNNTITFNGSAIEPDAGDTLSYLWDFSGVTASATTGSGPITVTYPDAGTFLVRLTVRDDKGNTDPNPPELTVNVTTGPPVFQFLPVITADSVINNVATYNLTVDENINVNVVTPEGSWTTPMMRYNGLQRSPVIVAARGMDMVMQVKNNLTEDTTVHWHGFKIPGIQDGGPDIVFLPGETKQYTFKMQQPAAPLWFHPHADGTTATQVYFGLAGAFILTDKITDKLEANNELPTGDHDIAMLVQDRRFEGNPGDAERKLLYQVGGGMDGSMLGNHILVNGVEMPVLDVDTRQYRFRLFNGSNARSYDFALDNNATFMVVGTDGGLLNNPVNTDRIKLSAGERAEIVIDFRNNNVGEVITLLSRSFNDGNMGGGGGRGNIPPNGAALNIMTFNVNTNASDNVILYTALPSNAEINSRLVDNVDVTAITPTPFVMSASMAGGMAGGPGGRGFVINGVPFDINRLDPLNPNPNESFKSNTKVIWDISNTSAMAHPFHAHAIQWQIMGRGQADANGALVGTLTDATGIDLGWTDTVLVQPGQLVRFIGFFDPTVNVGLYMYHCHILEHEDAGMMGVFEVIP